MMAEIESIPWDRTVICGDNAHVHARFALALLAPTEYVALFDDDAIPGEKWIENCLHTMQKRPGILGAVGVRLMSDGYRDRTLHGWRDPSDQVTEVDLVGHAWFLRTEWVHYLFRVPAVLGTNGEDIELSARAWRFGRIRTFCPPHPQHDRSLWGSLHGDALGSDAAAASRRPTHLDERDQVVRAEIAAGWTPFIQRKGDIAEHIPAAPQPPYARRKRIRAAQTSDGIHSTLLELIPTAARRILEINGTNGELAKHVRARQQASLRVLVGNEATKRRLLRDYDMIDVVDFDEQSLSLGTDSYDCITCHWLATIRNPRTILRQARDLLADGGRLIASIPNVRHHNQLAALLEGSWINAPQGVVDPANLRLFTRREIEKLFFRSGLTPTELQPVPGPGYSEWVREGRPREVKVGALHITGLSAEETEEFYTAHYSISAVAAPSVNFGLTSIILVTFNELAYTRMCLESLWLRTDEPFEVIVIDNGSSDGTVEYLRSLSNVRLIRNDINLGFPAAANQGIRAAKGQQVLLLNNDCIVTTGWLHRLLQALHCDPKIGLVGPCSNQVSGNQQVAVNYEDLSELDGFAWDWSRDRRGMTEDTDRLVGFCLLMRKEVTDKVGFLDERFGTGCFEDDDYCLRALQGGYRAVIARDAFVHHFGGRTFVGSGVDFVGLMERNQRLFEEKWAQRSNQPAAAVSSLPEVATPPKPRFTFESTPEGLRLLRARPLLSMCMIARDNEKTIGAALRSIRRFVDDMVVVDTGSKDATPEIARQLGARVFHFPWCDDFSAARNVSFGYALGEWIFWMDSDDTITEENARKLRELVCRTVDPGILGYVIAVHCPSSDPSDPDSFTRVTHVKLIRNLPHLRFTGRIHEQLLPAIQKAGGRVEFTELFVDHSGYDTSPEGQAKKLERDLRILHKELSDQPNHPFVLFNLGMTYTDMNEFSEATGFLQRCLASSSEKSSHIRKTYAYLVHCHQRLGKHAEAWDACQQGLRLFPLDTELRFNKANMLHEQGRLKEAEETYLDVLNRKEAVHFTSVNEGINNHLTRHNLAMVYRDLGDREREEMQWRQILQERPRYQPARQRLQELLAARRSHH